MARFRRKDLKRPDAFVSTSRQVIDWAVDNRTRVLVGAGALAVVVIAILATTSIRGSQRRQANEELAEALALLRADQSEQAATELKGVAERWSGTTAAVVAELFAIRAEIEADDPGEAAEPLRQLVDDSVDPDYLEQQAVVTLASLEAQAGNWEAAADLYARAKAMSGPYTGVAMLGEARSREKLGALDIAMALYRDYLEEFPTSGDDAYIRLRLSELEKG